MRCYWKPLRQHALCRFASRAVQDVDLMTHASNRRMRAQLLTTPGRPLAAAELPEPRPGPGQVLLAVRACAVCRTDLHVVDGELPHPKLPLIPGHEIVGIVVERGGGGPASRSATGSACRGSAGLAASARYCRSGRRICATTPASPAIRSTADMPS